MLQTDIHSCLCVYLLESEILFHLLNELSLLPHRHPFARPPSHNRSFRAFFHVLRQSSLIVSLCTVSIADIPTIQPLQTRSQHLHPQDTGGYEKTTQHRPRNTAGIDEIEESDDRVVVLRQVLVVFVKHEKGEGKYETNDSGGGVSWCRRHVCWLEDFLLSQALDLTVWLA